MARAHKPLSDKQIAYLRSLARKPVGSAAYERAQRAKRLTLLLHERRVQKEHRQAGTR